MNHAVKHSVLAWALIAAQLLVVGLSQGRMVVCHKANGSSHIELVGDTAADHMLDEQLVSSSFQGVVSRCSDGACVDEMLPLGLTITRSRVIELGHALGVVPNAPPMGVVWSMPEVLEVSSPLMSDEVEVLALIDQRVRLRTTVLNL